MGQRAGVKGAPCGSLWRRLGQGRGVVVKGRLFSECLPAEVGILPLKSNQQPGGKEKDYHA